MNIRTLSFVLIPALYLASCSKTEVCDIQNGNAPAITVAAFPTYDNAGKADYGITDTGKASWTEGDEIFLNVSASEDLSGACMYKLVMNGGAWTVSDVDHATGSIISPSENWETQTGAQYYEAYYAPSYTIGQATEGAAYSMVLAAGKADGTDEFMHTKGAWTTDERKIAFTRDYSRIRVVTAAGYKAVLDCYDFVPQGLAGKPIKANTLATTADSNGNAFFYGTMTGTTRIYVTIFNGSTEVCSGYLDGKSMENGKSYAVNPSEKSQVLAKWMFTPARAISDGYVRTWTGGLEELGAVHYTNQPGEVGYINANDKGHGKLSYVQIDKSSNSENPADNKVAGYWIFNVSNGGQPMICGPLAGDYWQFETTGNYNLPAGSKIHVVYTYAPTKYGQKYWLVQYKDGNSWKPAFPISETTISLSGETITYNLSLVASEFKIVEFTATLENDMTDFVFRQVCCSEYQVNNKYFTAPRTQSESRIAGDPNNAVEKPSPEIDLVL